MLWVIVELLYIGQSNVLIVHIALKDGRDDTTDEIQDIPLKIVMLGSKAIKQGTYFVGTRLTEILLDIRYYLFDRESRLWM